MHWGVMNAFRWGLKGTPPRRIADGPPWIVYDFENVFDWRSGPRRGNHAAPIPIHLPP